MTHNNQHRVSQYTKKRLDAYLLEKNISKDLFSAYTYESLDSLLDLLPLSYRDFLNLVNRYPEYPVDWATDTQARMADNLDRLNEKQKNRIRGIVFSLIPEQIKEALEESENKPLGFRVNYLIEKGFNEDNYASKMYIELGLADKWSHHKSDAQYLSCSHEFMPAIAAKTGISLHWILNCKKPVLAKTESTETVMDYFCFLPKDHQKTIEQALSTALKAGGIVIENE